MSEALSSFSPRHCSGDMYFGEPITAPARVNCCSVRFIRSVSSSVMEKSCGCGAAVSLVSLMTGRGSGSSIASKSCNWAMPKSRTLTLQANSDWFEPDVFRFEIAVQNAQPMSFVNRRAGLAENVQRVSERQRTFVFELGGQRDAFKVFHHQI